MFTIELLERSHDFQRIRQQNEFLDFSPATSYRYRHMKFEQEQSDESETNNSMKYFRGAIKYFEKKINPLIGKKVQQAFDF